MSIRYIALVGQPSRTADTRHALERSTECRLDAANLSVFTESHAPTLLLPGGRGILIGSLFSLEGERILDSGALPRCAPGSFANILEQCWDEYLLIAQDPAAPNSITVLRDPSGGVHCAYRIEAGSGFLTSDVSLAVQCGQYQREVDWAAITDTLIQPHRRSARTTLAGIRELLPGCSLSIDEGDAYSCLQWSPWNFISPKQRHSEPKHAAADVRQAVSRVVKSYSSLDQRMLVQLSGGLDSSIVATSLGAASERAILSTLVMPVAGTDERPYAQQVADAMHRDLLPVHVAMEDVRFNFSYPASAVLPIPGVLQHATNLAWETAATAHAASALYSGSGGDTIFCYLKTAAPAADAFRTQGFLAGVQAIRDLSSLHHCTLWTAGRLTLKKLARGAPSLSKSDRSFLNAALVAGQNEAHPWLQAPPSALPGDRERIADLIGTQLYRHARPFGETRAMRFPLLAQPVLEACLRTPSWMWIAGGLNRAVARDAFSDRLPRGIRQRRSKGSYTGFLAGLYERNRAEIRAMLAEGELAAAGLLDVPALDAYIQQGLAPRDLSFLRTFDLCAVEAWVRTQRQYSSTLE